MAILALHAFAVPPVLYPDRVTGVPDMALKQLRNEGARGYTVPPGFMQVVEAQSSGPYPYRAEGTLVYRSLFGVAVGSMRSYDRGTRYELASGKVLGLWLAFLALEAGLLVALYRTLADA